VILDERDTMIRSSGGRLGVYTFFWLMALGSLKMGKTRDARAGRRRGRRRSVGGIGI
jgi:hypothetical protein